MSLVEEYVTEYKRGFASFIKRITTKVSTPEEKSRLKDKKCVRAQKLNSLLTREDDYNKVSFIEFEIH